MKDSYLDPRKTTVKLLVIHNVINGDKKSHVESKSIATQDEDEDDDNIHNKPLICSLYS